MQDSSNCAIPLLCLYRKLHACYRLVVPSEILFEKRVPEGTRKSHQTERKHRRRGKRRDFTLRPRLPWAMFHLSET